MGHGFTTDKFIRGLQRARVPASPVGYESNLSAGAREGTSVAAHATTPHSVGNFVQVIASTVNDAHGVWIQARNETSTAITGANLRCLLSLAVGGVGAESIVIPDMNFCNTDLDALNFGVGTRLYHFPGIYIPAGSRISLQSRASLAPFSVVCTVMLDPMLSIDVVETTVVAYGAVQASSQGTTVAPGSGSFGAWVEIGTTSRGHSVWAVGYDFLADTSVAQTTVLIELGFGPDSGSVTSLGFITVSQNSVEIISGAFPPVLYSSEVPSGTKVWARIASAETENRGIIIYGV